MRYDAEIPQLFISYVQEELKQELRSCYPRDIVNQVCWSASYDGKEPYIDRNSLQRAIAAYFAT